MEIALQNVLGFDVISEDDDTVTIVYVEMNQITFLLCFLNQFLFKDPKVSKLS